MSSDTEKLILDAIDSLREKLDAFIESTHKENSLQNERIKAVETKNESMQSELTEYKNFMGKQFDKRGHSVFQIIGAIASGMTVIGLIITWILLMAKGIV